MKKESLLKLHKLVKEFLSEGELSFSPRKNYMYYCPRCSIERKELKSWNKVCPSHNYNEGIELSVLMLAYVIRDEDDFLNSISNIIN